MPIGTFVPFDPTDLSPRYFARPIAFDCECPKCGRLLLVGQNRRDNASYNRVTGILDCQPSARSGVGCGHRFVIGLVAWNLPPGPRIPERAPDQRPSPRQLAEIRQAARGVWPKKTLQKQEPVNSIQELP